MVLGRMIYFFLPERVIFGIKAASVAKHFVLMDIASFTVQVVGGVMLSMNASPSTTLDGTHVYMGGVGMQECFILCFMALAITFHRRMLVLESRGETTGRTGWKKLLITLYVVLTLITVSSLAFFHFALIVSICSPCSISCLSGRANMCHVRLPAYMLTGVRRRSALYIASSNGQVAEAQLRIPSPTTKLMLIVWTPSQYWAVWSLSALSIPVSYSSDRRVNSQSVHAQRRRNRKESRSS